MTPRRSFEHDPSYSETGSSTNPPATGSETRQVGDPHIGHDPHSGHGGHGLMMMICCVPMLLIAVALVATGVAGSGIIVKALLCTTMMAAMMFAMPGGHGRQ